MLKLPRVPNCAGMKMFFNSYAFLVKINTNSWILDSGASEHMTFNKHLLFNFKPLGNTITVTLPNSHKVKVTHYGSVNLLQNLILHNVLYIPSFKFSLMSIQKLC